MSSSQSADSPDTAPAGSRSRRLLLLFSVFVVGACGLIYELAAGAVASYLMGDSVTQYSLVIGTFLAAMGLGSWLTQWMREKLLGTFLLIQLIVGVVGGFSALLVFAAFAHLEQVTFVVVGCTVAVGTLVGMEIPLILRLLRSEGSLRVTVAQVLSADYVGALVAAVAFPFLVLPLLGLVRAPIVFGMLNVLIGSLGTALFWEELPQRYSLLVYNGVAWMLLLLGLVASNQATTWLEDRLYQDEIILAETTPYQRIVVTRWRDDIRLHLNGHLQFSSADEYRYHEPLVLPAVSAAIQLRERDSQPLRILLLGGGDGLVARQALPVKEVGQIDLVDIDQRVVEIFRDIPLLSQLNRGALADARVTPHFADAFIFLRDTPQKYDVIIMDLPDPSSLQTNKLYTTTFFGLALRRLTGRGVLVTQASSPFYARRTFWCIAHTMSAALERMPAGAPSRRLIPYHAYVPSFGEWGFVMIVPAALSADQFTLVREGRFLTPTVFEQCQNFPPDSAEVPTEINQLDNPVLVRYHAADWSRWGE